MCNRNVKQPLVLQFICRKSYLVLGFDQMYNSQQLALQPLMQL